MEWNMDSWGGLTPTHYISQSVRGFFLPLDHMLHLPLLLHLLWAEKGGGGVTVMTNFDYDHKISFITVQYSPSQLQNNIMLTFTHVALLLSWTLNPSRHGRWRQFTNSLIYYIMVDCIGTNIAQGVRAVCRLQRHHRRSRKNQHTQFPRSLQSRLPLSPHTDWLLLPASHPHWYSWLWDLWNV